VTERRSLGSRRVGRTQIETEQTEAHAASNSCLTRQGGIALR
jgi:hypothetical protein